MTMVSGTPVRRLSLSLLLVGGLAACGTIQARLDALPTTRVTTLPASQACDAPEENERRLTGAFLRQSSASGPSFVPVLVTGRENRNGLTERVTVNEQSQTREVADLRGTTFVGARSGEAMVRSGFGSTDVLPNVYDVSFAAQDVTFSGPMVLGPGAFNREVPTSGARVFSGTIAIDLITQDDSGAATTTRARGRFALQAGYGSGSATLVASGFGAALPFETLRWSNLFLCGTRFVSSGKGVVTVAADGGPALPPFKEGRETTPFTALFQSVQFAAFERPAPPISLGGVFVIQSDRGTLTGVFLSDPVDPPDEEATDA